MVGFEVGRGDAVSGRYEVDSRKSGLGNGIELIWGKDSVVFAFWGGR